MTRASPVSPVEQLLLNTEKELLSLEELLFAKSARASQGGQQALANALQRLCQQARTALRDARESLDLTPPVDETDIEALARTYLKFADDVQTKFLRYFTESDQAFFPPEIRWAIHRLITEIDSTVHFELILHPADNKTLLTRMILGLERLASGLFAPGSVPPTDDRFWVMISYPQVHARNPFYHALILSHEALHVRDEIKGVSAHLAGNFNLLPKDADEIVESLKKRPVLPATSLLPPVTLGERVTEAQLRAEAGGRWGTIIASWLSEIVTDLMAVRLFGPSFLIAFAHHELARGMMATHSESHPCSLLRIEFMLGELGNMGYLGKGLKKPLRGMKKELAAIRRLIVGSKSQGQPLEIKAEQYIRAQKAQIATAAQTEVPGAYSADVFAVDVPDLLDLLAAGVPPGQIRDRATGDLREAGLAALLNAAFVFQSSQMGDLWSLVQANDNDARTRARLKLDELLLKAIELNEVALAWRLAAP
jgi:hypothetical protein